jgi:hypothetical protein
VSQRLARTMRPQLEPLLYDAEFRARERRRELAYVGGVPELGEGLAVFRVLAPGEAPRGVPPVDDRQRPVAPPPR